MNPANTGRDFLEHHGVKGMKWGVRRSRRSLRKAAESRGRKSVKDMSDDDLKKVVARLNMERQYTSLTSGKSGSSGAKKAVVLGSAFIGSIGLNVARQQLTNNANARVGQALTTRALRRAANTSPVRGVGAIGRTERR